MIGVYLTRDFQRIIAFLGKGWLKIQRNVKAKTVAKIQKLQYNFFGKEGNNSFWPDEF